MSNLIISCEPLGTEQRFNYSSWWWQDVLHCSDEILLLYCHQNSHDHVMLSAYLLPHAVYRGLLYRLKLSDYCDGGWPVVQNDPFELNLYWRKRQIPYSTHKIAIKFENWAIQNKIAKQLKTHYQMNADKIYFTMKEQSLKGRKSNHS